MKDLNQLMRSLHAGDSPPPRAPRVIFYIPPAGRAIHCNDVEAAKHAATLWAGKHPGDTVGIYELVGYAHQPIVPPDFTPTDSEKASTELLPSAPADVDFGAGFFDDPVSDGPAGPEDREHPDLTDERRETLRRLREAMAQEREHKD